MWWIHAGHFPIRELLNQHEKETGIEYDFSESNIKNSILKYAKYGISTLTEGGDYLSGYHI